MGPAWQPPQREMHAAIVAGCSIDDLASPQGAALLVLRTLDLLTKPGRRRQSVRHAFAHARSLLREFDPGDPEIQPLRDLLQAGAATCGSRPRATVEYQLATAFGAYALHLTDHDHIAVAVDVLETEWRILGASAHRRSVGRRWRGG